MSLGADMTPLEARRELSERVMPGLETALAKKYDDLLPGFSEWQIGTVYGSVYARDALDMKTRQLATVAGLAVMGAQTRPQLKIHVASALKIGATKQEIAETILQMSLYGGFPAAINALNAAMEVFDEEET
jgi:4-carboxymuconolactone decarboxylase